MIRYAVLVLIASLSVYAQTAPMQFEVASIKPSAPPAVGENRVAVGIAAGGRLTAQGVSTRMLMSIAFGVKEHEIIGGPAWLDTQRYDISAKPDAASVSGQINQDQMRLMIQALLAERFKLATHTENKEATVYAIVPGKNGAKVPESESTADSPNRQMRMGNGQLNATGLPMKFLADSLSRILGRTVVDKSGLTGLRDFKLQWVPDESTSIRMPGLPPPGGSESAAPPSDSKGPTLFAALEEQLGLKLNTEKGQVTNIVIDHIEKPSEN
jgi:uncharacterized protein (TIGR03435 family)